MQLPRRIHDLLLKLDQFFRLLGQVLLLFLLLAHGWRLSLPENFFKWSNLGKKHVAVGSTHISITHPVLGPEKPTYQLSRFHRMFLERNHMFCNCLQRIAIILRKVEFLECSSIEVVGDAMLQEPKVILDFRKK